MSKETRDQQRGKLYRAEGIVFDKGWNKNEYQTLAQCQAFLDKLAKDKTLNRWYPKLAQTLKKTTLEDGRGRRAACCEYGLGGTYTLKMPVWSRSRWTLCHELAHALNAEMHGYWRVAGHGWQFARIYIFLVQRGIGKQAADELKKSFKKHHVKFQAPKPKRELSPERKAELQERMKKMREAKMLKEGVAA